MSFKDSSSPKPRGKKGEKDSHPASSKKLSFESSKSHGTEEDSDYDKSEKDFLSDSNKADDNERETRRFRGRGRGRVVSDIEDEERKEEKKKESRMNEDEGEDKEDDDDDDVEMIDQVDVGRGGGEDEGKAKGRSAARTTYNSGSSAIPAVASARKSHLTAAQVKHGTIVVSFKCPDV